MRLLGNVRCWHQTDMLKRHRNVRFQEQSGKHVLALRFSAFDPKRTSVSQPRDIFQATGFCTYNAGKAPCETT